MTGFENVGFAFLLTLIAGLSTGIGSVIAFIYKKPNIRILCFSLGLSTGVMLYVSFVELLPDAVEAIGEIWALYAFFAGMIIMGFIDILIPDIENPHHYTDLENNDITENKNLMRLGLFSAFAIMIHNFPEGIATFGSALLDIRLGVIIAFAIAIHNIPEGIAVSVPIYFATNSKKKAFYYSFLSGFSEPLGAAISFLFLMQFLNLWTLSFLLSFSAGIMVYISVDELLPTAHRYGHGHCVIMGFIIGIFIMAVSILLL